MKEIFTKNGILMLYFYVLKCWFFLDMDLKIFSNGILKWRIIKTKEKFFKSMKKIKLKTFLFF